MIRKFIQYLLVFLSLAAIGTAAFICLSFRQYVDFKVISQVEGKQIKIANQIKMVQYLKLLGITRGVEMQVIGEILDEAKMIVLTEVRQ